MNIRKEREKEFFVEHMDKFKNAKVADPFFTIKTAFFKKGKYGRQVQFFEWELEKGEDIFVEFYDNVYGDNNQVKDVIPMNDDRALFKFSHNPYYAEEYELKESTNSQGNSYSSYVIPVSELTAVLNDGSEITYALYEKRKKEKAEELPKLQKSLSIFPDFDEEKEKVIKDPDYVPWETDDLKKAKEKSSPDLLKALDRIASTLEKIEKKIK